jgi:hypothetical protein
MATDRLRQLRRLIHARARTWTPCGQSIRTWTSESHSCSPLHCGRRRRAARGLPGAAGGPAPQMRRPCPGPPTRSSRRWARADGVLLIELDGNYRLEPLGRRAGQQNRHPRSQANPAPQLKHAIHDNRSARPSASVISAARPPVTAVTHALAPTGASYRVSPGSWPDFAQNEYEYLQLDRNL